MNELVFVADVHLVEDDPETDSFVRFLRSLPGRAECCVIVGDLFNVWIARRRFTTPSQARLLRILREVSEAGVRFKYVEGNRDYFVSETWQGNLFDEVAATSLRERIGSSYLLVSHGDLVNLSDRQYRAWRRFSRSSAIRALLNLLSSRRGQKLAVALEKRLRGTNQRHKQSLPEIHLERYAREAFSSGHQAVVLGHFHQEVCRSFDEGTLWILPDWKSGHRYLSFSCDGAGRFVSFPS
ncbi:MAG: UDP-2,3-diacylglucosamine diphosphatase [Acidobacteriota bacterium]